MPSNPLITAATKAQDDTREAEIRAVCEATRKPEAESDEQFLLRLVDDARRATTEKIVPRPKHALRRYEAAEVEVRRATVEHVLAELWRYAAANPGFPAAYAAEHLSRSLSPTAKEPT